MSTEDEVHLQVDKVCRSYDTQHSRCVLRHLARHHVPLIQIFRHFVSLGYTHSQVSSFAFLFEHPESGPLS